MPFSLEKLSYSPIKSTREFVDLNLGLLLDEELYHFSFPYRVKPPSTSHEFLNGVLLSENIIMEFMTLGDRPWEYSHHRSYFLPGPKRVEKHIQTLISTDVRNQSQFPSTLESNFSEGNLGNIS
jgi:hypothetical protein